jgi:hypothetical protein
LKHRLGIVGHIIALEFTWGDENGWHPHYHVILIHNEQLDANAIGAIHRHIHSRLAASCRDFGLVSPTSCTPSASTPTSAPRPLAPM